MVAKVTHRELSRKRNRVGGPRHIVVNGAGHTKGRLSATIAKALLRGSSVDVVGCERIVQQGDVTKNLHRWQRFLNLWGNSNPRIRSHQHWKAPSKMFWRCLRASLPHKTNRGLSAINRLRCFDGVPQTLWSVPMKKVPKAQAHLIYKPGRKHCTLGDLANRVGWKHGEEVAKLEVERKVNSKAHFETQQARISAMKNSQEEAAKILSTEDRKLLERACIL